ncbi:MAG: hypothetical protein A2Y10_11955 [Planctomycetes bacterium GWF2_41_51]|nr:MAG: hypothetical protein A2Y10_11955 [Planctomycetes bacterium GWF2_41_51]HBG28659.1 hypothetical protein [Phycisphaerales bacterium]
MSEIFYTSQSRLRFDINRLTDMGVKRAYVTPFDTNNEVLSKPEIILSNLEKLAAKAELSLKKKLEVFPFFITINHPEGNYQLPNRYRMQKNIDGSPRPAFICFRDKTRQQEMIAFAKKAAGLGFNRLMFDDDLRDAFCYCDEHITGFAGFKGKSRSQIEHILSSILDNPEYENLRQKWYEYKYQGMINYARQIEQAVHSINPKCRIGICTSAKRCQDFSGRNPADWLKVFSTEDAPAFTRLCGECYDDDIRHICQSTGWSQYMNDCYPENTEKMLEVTSVPAVSYRSSGSVMFETDLVIAATAQKTIHWCWPEEFERTGLCDAVIESKNHVLKISEEIKTKPQSPLCIYIDSNLGSYTPINISVPYGATDDPINAYNIISLLGLPVIIRPAIPENQPAIICSSYISRKMIANIDEYIFNGGVTVLDSRAAECYRIYGGQVAFNISGSFSLNRYEILSDGSRCDIIADCPSDSISYIETNEDLKYKWRSFNVDGKEAGCTAAIFALGKGKLIIFGYNLSRTKQVLLCSQWRNRVLDILSFANIDFSVYWKGPVAVQCFYYDKKTILANYNASIVAGEIKTRFGQTHSLSLKPYELKIVKMK